MLFHGDCIEQLQYIEDDSVDLICADLPYGQTEAKWDKKIDLQELWKEFKRVRKDTTPIFMFGTLKFGLELIEANPKEFRYEIIWDKVTSSSFLWARRKPMQTHEYIFVFYKTQPLYDLESNHEIGEKGKSEPITHKHRDMWGCSHRTRGRTYTPKLPISIWTFVKKRNKINQTAKPVELLKKILKYYSREGDTVLDPTMGSGSMLLACRETNRVFHGIEMDEEQMKYCADL